MKLNIKESYEPSAYTSFGIENDEITYSKGFYPNNKYTKIKLPKNSHFINIYEFLATCNPFCDNTVPVELSEFNTIDFNKIDSELTLSWVDDNGVYKTIRATLYNYPTYVTNADLNKYGIKLKKDSEVDTLESCKHRKSKKKRTKESFDNSEYLDNDNCLGYGIQIRNMNSGYIDLLCYNTKDLATQNLTIAELMEDSDNYDADYYEDDFNTIYGTTDNLFQEIDYRRDLDNGRIYGKEKVLVYGNDDGFYVVINKIPVDLYF